ncbi:hypothetical protein L207DRAFT_446536 [Hyaloscypha variabilis F]|uniref:Saponin hydrolase n=1 Tax=Hyaloscypha variabilis (strain UAMH 11265 / GT02V1 / F) TaxID=1149755 RepID=A0A2J6QRD2_HYAVF|nr:hypothetical protein L207DRAFT_446536 [Hyaloscypha variabilis F]
MRFTQSFIITFLNTITFATKGASTPLSKFSIGQRSSVPPPPAPEPITVVELPLPPVSQGACTLEINPHGTGCMSPDYFFQSGNFLPDDNHVVALLNFTGAPAAPDPASIYSGLQAILIKADGTTFPNGDPWKCVTCGVPAENMVGSTPLSTNPQAFKDGKRMLAEYNVVDCGDALLADADCTPDKVYIYPIRWNVEVDGSGTGGSIREIRIHPDDVHLGFNSYTYTAGALGEVPYFSRLQFNPSPTTGTPLAPRYDLVNVTALRSPVPQSVLSADGDQLIYNLSALSVGELRGFTGLGNEVTYLGPTVESGNFDVFAADLTTGVVRRITSDTGYTDPLDVSPDSQWNVVLTTLESHRMEFVSGMRGVPPIIDTVAVGTLASIRNNGPRRFFQPWLLDYYGDRGGYNGQLINAAGDGNPGSINDPNWNANADPKFSHGGNKIAYFQVLVIPPECGGTNPLPCPTSTEPGGRVYRLMLATLTSRTPPQLPPVEPVSDVVPWGTPYVPGAPSPLSSPLLNGSYTLKGKVSGSAYTKFTLDNTESYVKSVSATYENYSDDGIHFIFGSENVTTTPLNLTLSLLDWHSDLVSYGETISTKITGLGGFHVEDDETGNIFEANGTLTTTVGAVVYRQPVNGG